MFRPLFASLALLALTLAPLTSAEAGSASTEPSIVFVRGTAVLVQVPDGFAAVHLQVLTAPPKGRAAAGQKAARPQWKTVAGKRTDGKAGYVRLMAPALTPLRYLRVYGLRAQEVPKDLLGGASSFGPDLLSVDGTPVAGNTYAGSVTLDRGAVLNAGGVMAMASTNAFVSSTTATPARTVSESDIWKIDADRLYFYNSTRGLQAFDISNPDDPAILGTLHLQGRGEEMYLLDRAHVVLLTEQAANGGWSWSESPVVPNGGGVFTIGIVAPIELRPVVLDIGVLQPVNGGIFALANHAALQVIDGDAQFAANGAAGQNQVALAPAVAWGNLFGAHSPGSPNDEHAVVVADVRGAPTEIARIAFKGALRESRLVGKVLYLCTYTTGLAGGDSLPAAATKPTLNVFSFDLSDPSNPVQRGHVSFDGSEAAVYATDRYFFVAPSSVTISTSVYSTHAEASTQVQVVDISDPTGKISLAGSVPARGFVRDKFKMNLEGDVFTVVGQDAIAPQPGYFSYYGTPVSVVSTFSLKDPKAPVALGTLEVAPGEALFATRYVGTRLYLVTTTPQYVDPLAIIDLADPTKPTILGELHVPGYSTYIEPIGDRLVTTGMQNHTAKVELYDISDPTAPAQISGLALGAPESGVISEAVSDEKAFTVLPEQGLILLPVASGYSWNGENASGVQIIDLLETGLVKRGVITANMSPRRATVHRGQIVSISATKLVAVDAADRDHPVTTAEVDISWSVDRVLLAGKHLLEVTSGTGVPGVIVAPVDQPDAPLGSLTLPAGTVLAAEARGDVLYVVQCDQGPLTVSSISLAHLPKITLLGQVTAKTASPGSIGFSNSALQSLWVNDRTLVLTGSTVRSGLVRPIASNNANGFAPTSIGFFSGRTRDLVAVDVTTPSKPKFASTLSLGENRSWQVGPAVAANDTVYVSYKVAPHTYPLEDGAAQDADPEAVDGNKYYLKQIDFSDSANPSISDARVNIPGELRAVSQQGSVLYTVGGERNPANGDSLNKDFALHASSFDGTAAHLLDQLPLSGPSQPFTVSGETVFLLDVQPENTWVPGTPPAEPALATNADLTLNGSLTLTPSNATNGTWTANPKKSTLSTWEIGSDGKFAQRDTLKLDREAAFRQFGGLTVLRSEGPSVRFIDSRDPQTLRDLGAVEFDAAGSSSLNRAAADLARGLWLPLGANGVEFVGIDK